MLYLFNALTYRYELGMGHTLVWDALKEFEKFRVSAT